MLEGIFDRPHLSAAAVSAILFGIGIMIAFL